MIEAASSSAAGVANAIFTGSIAVIVAVAGLITAVKAPRAIRRSKETRETVGVIHKLVDGNLTASKIDTLNATRRELVTLREVQRLHDEAGHTQNPDALAEIARTVIRIAELETEIVERRATDDLATPAEWNHRNIKE